MGVVARGVLWEQVKVENMGAKGKKGGGTARRESVGAHQSKEGRGLG